MKRYYLIIVIICMAIIGLVIIGLVINTNSNINTSSSAGPPIANVCCYQIHNGSSILFEVVTDSGYSRDYISAWGNESYNRSSNISYIDQMDQKINISDNIQCCDYISDPNACNACVDEAIEKRKINIERNRINLQIFYNRIRDYRINFIVDLYSKSYSESNKET